MPLLKVNLTLFIDLFIISYCLLHSTPSPTGGFQQKCSRHVSISGKWINRHKSRLVQRFNCYCSEQCFERIVQDYSNSYKMQDTKKLEKNLKNLLDTFANRSDLTQVLEILTHLEILQI